MKTLMAIFALPFIIYWSWILYVETRPFHYAFRFKVTIEVDTREGPRTGSSVMEFRRSPRYNLFRQKDTIYVEHTLNGTAPILNLGRDGWLFSPLAMGFPPPCGSIGSDGTDRTTGMLTVAARAFGLTMNEEPTRNTLARLPRTAPIVLDVRDYPTLIWLPPSGSLPGCVRFSGAQLRKLGEGHAKLTQIAIEPTAERMLSAVPVPAPEWVEQLRRDTGKIPERERDGIQLVRPIPLHIRQLEN
jgi:hypothetical protein